MAQKDNINLAAYVLGGLSKDKINQIIEFLNEKLKMADEEGEWENFKYASKEACQAENVPTIIYRFYTKGGKENQATPRNAIYFFNM